MESIPENKLLQFNPDTLSAVRKEINLDKPGAMKASIEILKAWIRKQPHFRKKDFSEHLLESAIVMSKGSLERAKRQIDKMCTMRSLWPHFFQIDDVRKEFADIVDIGSLAIMPKLTKEHHRIIAIKLDKSVSNSVHLLQHYKLGVCIIDYLKAHDYVNSYQYILDMRQANMADFLSAFNLTDFRQIMSILLDCYALRIKGIHIISNSKLIDTFFAILKQLLKPKLVSRLRHYTDIDDLVSTIGKQYLPVELGGTEKSVRDIQEDWLEELSSKQHMEYMRFMREAATDEELRPKGTFSEDYAGMPGTFRLLTVD